MINQARFHHITFTFPRPPQLITTTTTTTTTNTADIYIFLHSQSIRLQSLKWTSYEGHIKFKPIWWLSQRSCAGDQTKCAFFFFTPPPPSLLTSAEPVRPVSHVGDTFTITRNEDHLLACSREKMKSRSTVGSRLAHCELAKKNCLWSKVGGETRV